MIYFVLSKLLANITHANPVLIHLTDMDIPGHMAGLWTGKVYSADGITSPCCTSLAFLAQDHAYPSLFGATLDAQDRVAIVHGSWQRELNEVRMKEIAHDVSRRAM